MKTAAAARQQQGRVLVVEDERDVADLIRYNLTKEGYDVVVAPTGSDALKQAREVHPDLVLLDIMVPQLNGWEVCRRLKQDADTKNIPVIMVTGRVEEGDKVLGFEMGADDYVTKPFSPRELFARIRAVARRARPGDAEKKPHVQIGELEIDRYRFEVRMKGHPVDLTPKEFELLATLAGAPGRAGQGREQLELLGGEVHRVALHANLEAVAVDLELADLHVRLLLGVAGTGAAGDRADAGEQLARRERLGHVVVGAHLEAEDLVALLDAAGDHDHGDVLGVRVLLEAAADLPAVELRDHDVEQDQVGVDLARLLEGVGAGGGDDDVVTLLGEVVADQVGDVALVFDDEDATLLLAGRGGGLHPSPSVRGARYRTMTPP